MTVSLVGRVLTVTRRYVDLIDQNAKTIRGKVGIRDLELCVGDQVTYIIEKDEVVVDALLPRANLLKRSYFGKTRLLTANLEQVYIITAPVPLFNPSTIDRVLCAAQAEQINCTLLLNKSDLKAQLKESEGLLSAYRSIGVSIMFSSTVESEGLEELKAQIASKADAVIALVGVSGVGKSSIIKALYPELSPRIQEVSSKTGQGKQTTSQAHAFAVPAFNGKPFFLVDLPGIQNYGITHLSPGEIRENMPEIAALQARCRFKDCWHEEEPECAVKRALEIGNISESRYRSYVDMLRETRAVKKYS